MYYEESFGVVLRTGAALFALIAAYRFILVPTMVEGFRQNIFELRRELFRMMADGKIEPTHKAYVVLRGSMNAMLRFAERVTFMRGLLGMLFVPEVVRYREGPHDAIASISDPLLRGRIEDIYGRYMNAITRHMILTSPAAWVLVLLVVLYRCVAIAMQAQNQAVLFAFKRPTDAVEAEAAESDISSHEAVAA